MMVLCQKSTFNIKNNIFFEKSGENTLKLDFYYRWGYPQVVPPGGGGTTLLHHPGVKIRGVDSSRGTSFEEMG
jgi:hypothetical protein